MKTLLSLALVLFAAQGAFAFGQDRGGGDLCEDRIQEIGRDLNSWIGKGGPDSLLLPTGVSADKYSEDMQKAIGSAKVRCVKPGDKGYPVAVFGTAKVCNFERTASSTVITCDYNTFLDKQKMDESAQYVLIHHEYAGVAGLENPDLDVSSYTLSNQLSGYLVEQTVKKLAVKPKSAPTAPPQTKLARVQQLYEQATAPATIADINKSEGTQECHYIAVRSPDYIEPSSFYFGAIKKDIPADTDPVFPKPAVTNWYFVIRNEEVQASITNLEFSKPAYPYVVGRDLIVSIPWNAIRSKYPCEDEDSWSCYLPEMNFKIRKNNNLLVFQATIGRGSVYGYCADKK